METSERLQLLEAVLADKGLGYEVLPGAAGIGFSIESQEVVVTFLAREERDAILCAGRYPFRVGEGRLGEVAEATNRINRLQKRGVFFVDFAEGAIEARYCHWLGKRTPSRDEWSEVLDVTVLGLFTWFPVFARILHGEEAVAELVRERVASIEADAPDGAG
jgi:hypothetical protein